MTTTTSTLGQVLYSFFTDYLITVKGLRPTSIESYRDTMKLLIRFVSTTETCKLSELTVADLGYDQLTAFLRHLETDRGNSVRTRNHRLAVLHTFFEYLAGRVPEMLLTHQRLAAIPMKRVPPPETRFLEHDQVAELFERLPKSGRHALRDRALFLLLYNTGARVQEVADLRRSNLELTSSPRVRLHGKGDKWRVCPLWKETAHQLQLLLDTDDYHGDQDPPVFRGDRRRPLTRSGIYKLVRRHASWTDGQGASLRRQRTTPHVFRHTTAVHLLEAGVEANVIRGWLGHSSLDTTNRYAEINFRTKEAALRACEAPAEAAKGFPRKPVWSEDETLLKWLASL